MKRLISALLCLCLLAGCAPAPGQKQYTATFLTLFDTVTTVMGRASDQEAFTAQAQRIHDALLEYHQLFDIYQEYPGLNNLKTVNDAAGLRPVTVDQRIIDLLLDCKEYYRLTGGTVNIAMGGVLRLWHEARADSLQDPAHPRLPPEDALREAAGHGDPEAIVIDEEASSVFLSDPLVRLDVGAIGKGYVTEMACRKLEEAGLTSAMVSVGGNIRTIGVKDGGEPWFAGIQNPDVTSEENYIHRVALAGETFVTSGTYQRYYTVDGVPYHHIIHPDTLKPWNEYVSVSVVCSDSGLADALATAVFNMEQEEGLALVERLEGVEVMWIRPDGSECYSSGFKAYLEED